MPNRIVEYEQEQIKECRERWFGKHKVVLAAPAVQPSGVEFPEHTSYPSASGLTSALPKMVIFMKPGTGMYYVKLVLSGGTLFVDGDIGSAAYRWNCVLGWESFLGFSLDYFAGKCEASEKGRRYTTWNSEIARWYLDDHLEMMDSELVEMGEKPRYTPHWNEIKGTYLGEYIEDGDSWQAAIHNGDIDPAMLGDSDCEWLWDIGTVPDVRVIGHWVACRMVGEHMKAKREEREKVDGVEHETVKNSE